MKILVFTKNWLGDVVLEEPAIRMVKKSIPQARLIAATSPRCVEILKANPYVDEVIAFDEKTIHRNFFARLAFATALRRKRIDQVLFFHRSSTRAWLAFLAGIPERIGYANQKRHFLLTKPIPDRSRPIHDVQYFMDLARDAGFQAGEPDYECRFYFTAEDEARALSLLSQCGVNGEKPLVAVNPGANWAPKRWPVLYYRELIQKLVDRYPVQVLITGGREDAAIAESVLSGADGRPVWSVCGQTRIRELGALFSKCRLVISNDSGPLHIGAGVGANVIGIFGPTAPRETAPMGRGRNIVIHYAPEGARLPWKEKHFPHGDWMERIRAEDVLEVIRREKLLEPHETH